jgi:hypothetical protein
MNHTWKRAPNRTNSAMTITSTYVCTRCGLKRERVLTAGEFYERSGLFYAKQKPDCIDWEIENSKTID